MGAEDILIPVMEVNRLPDADRNHLVAAAASKHEPNIRRVHSAKHAFDTAAARFGDERPSGGGGCGNAAARRARVEPKIPDRLDIDRITVTNQRAWVSD